MAVDETQLDEIIDLLDEEEKSSWSERRDYPRKLVNLPFRFLIKNSTGELVEDYVRQKGGVVIDISKRGIGIMTDEIICPGDVFYGTSLDGKICFRARLRVIHSRRTKDGNFRHGCSFEKVIA